MRVLAYAYLITVTTAAAALVGFALASRLADRRARKVAARNAAQDAADREAWGQATTGPSLWFGDIDLTATGFVVADAPVTDVFEANLAAIQESLDACEAGMTAREEARGLAAEWDAINLAEWLGHGPKETS